MRAPRALRSQLLARRFAGAPEFIDSEHAEAQSYAEKALKSLRAGEISKTKTLFWAANAYQERAQRDLKEVRELNDKIAGLLGRNDKPTGQRNKRLQAIVGRFNRSRIWCNPQLPRVILGKRRRVKAQISRAPKAHGRKFNAPGEERRRRHYARPTPHYEVLGPDHAPVVLLYISRRLSEHGRRG